MIKKLFLVLLLLYSPALAQLDFHETFEGGVCGETWAAGCPTTIVNAATMTGSYYLDLAAHKASAWDLNDTEVWVEAQLNINGNPTANSTFINIRNAAGTNRCSFFVNSAELLRIINSGGTTTNTPTTLSLNTNYTIEMRAKTGTGANAECAVRVNGGSWTASTDGTWTDNADEVEMLFGSNPNFFFDEIKVCKTGEISTCEVDVVAPTPGAGVTIAGATPSSLDVSVVAGTDDVTAQANLQYEFRRSLSNNMGSVANAEANGTIVRAYTANDVTHTDTGLTSGVTYYYQVIIKDEAGNKAIHTTAKEAALVIGEAGVTHCRKCPGLYRVPDQILPEGQEEEVYTDTQLIVLGGAEPRTWAIESGALPDGLSLSAAGVISGTVSAAEAGTHNFRVVVTEANGGKAKGNLSIIVNVAVGGGGALAFYEDAEDGNLTANPAWTSAGGCAVTSTGVLEGNDEVTKSSSTDCVLFDNVDEPQVYFGLDILDTLPSTNRTNAIVVLGSSNEELVAVRYEADGDIFVRTPGQTENSNRGHHMGYTPDVAGDSAYLEIRYIAGSGTDATLEARLNGGAIKTFSAGTATANVDRIILRDDNDAAGDFVYDRIEAKDNDWPGRGPLTPPDPPPPPDPPGPWVTDFTPLRTHYVSASGSGSGTSIGDPESFSQARTHYLCGDLHLYRGGTYLNGGTSALFSRTCTENAPAVFKGYVDPTTGQPENAEWKFGVESAGAWTWFVNIHRNNIGVSPTGESGGFLARLSGVRVINSVVHDPPGSNISAFRNSGNPSHPGQVMYGNITYRAGPGTNGAHNYYVQNDFAAQGYKYFVQNISLEPGGNPGGTTGGRRLFQMNDSNGDRGINGIWFEKNFFGDAAVTPDGHTIVWDMSGVSLWQPAFKIIFNDNFFVDHFHSTSLLHSVRTTGPSLQAEFRRNYFAKANLALNSYWGAQGTRDPWVFRENEIYDPPGGIHLPVFRTNKQSGAAAGAAGSFKIPDADDWDANIYGGTFSAQLHCNNTNSGSVNLATWRTATDACRVTPASAVGFDINSTNPANPTTDKVVVTVNEYQCSIGCPFNDQARGNIYCVNWDGNSTCSADISSVVGPGKTYKVRYPRDFFGTVAVEGTCPGSGACNVSLPTRRTSGEASGKFANAWVITGQP